MATQAQAPEGLKLGEDFPYVCETCLGPNPYLRMLKMPFGRECKISGRPYTAFRWKPGTEARYKETIIAPEVAVAKGVCQTCLMDMTFNVPVAVRDTVLGVGPDASARPQSETNKEFYWDQQRKAFLEGRQDGAAAPGLLANASDLDKMRGMARSAPHYDRNLPKLCSFWIKGTCTRVLNRDCPYRPCNGTYRFPELNSNYKELSKDLTERLNKAGPVEVMKSLDPVVDDIKEKLLDSQRGNRTEAIRNRYHGVKDSLADKYFEKKGDRAKAKLEPPEDQGIATLFVGNLPQGCTKEELSDHFYAHGEISTIRVLDAKGCAFVEYRTRAGAEAAAEALAHSLTVRGQRVRVQWGKSKDERETRGKPTAAAATSGAAAEAKPWEAEAGPFGQPSFYPSMDPSAMGARPEK